MEVMDLDLMAVDLADQAAPVALGVAVEDLAVAGEEDLVAVGEAALVAVENLKTRDVD